MPAIPSRPQQDRSPERASSMAAVAGLVGVVGAGTMGNGIAQTCAMAGFTVVLIDTSQAALDTARVTIAASLQRITGKGQLAASDAAAAQARITATTDYGALRDAACVVEAVSEEPALKLQVLASLGDMLAGDALLATNTSSISITALGAVIANPQRFIGLHFFNPVPLMPLVEVVRGAQTSDETERIARAFLARLSKQPVLVADHPGFVVNRLLCPMLNEAFLVLGEGLASAADIDAAMKLGCSYPIGPLALADVIGLDVLLDVMKVLHRELASDKYRPAPRLLELVAAGELGRKSGRGVFGYHSSHSNQSKLRETP